MRASGFALFVAVPVAFFAACSGGGLTPSDSGPVGTGGLLGTGGTPVGTGGAGPTTGGSASVGGLGGENVGGAGGADTGAGGTDTDGCHPRVHLLMQRSGAMFQSPAAEDNWWDAVADALDGEGDLLGEFGSEVELSFSVFTKVMDEATCPLGAEVSAPVGAGDLADVLEDEAADYQELATNLVKVDAPVVDAVEDATALLSGEDDAYIVLLVSDIPDSCETNDTECTAEDVFRAVQAAHTGGIQTRLMYLQSGGANIADYPEGVANAGAGLGIGLPPTLTSACGDDFDYSDAPGDAPFEAPADTASVEQSLRDLLTDIASCN